MSEKKGFVGKRVELKFLFEDNVFELGEEFT